MKKILEWILKKISSAILKRHRPLVVGVTGSMGKTSTKEAIFAVLSSKFKVRRNLKNYNNEIGVPLAIIGGESGGRSLFKWLSVFLKGTEIIISQDEYPEVLVLEMGADKPGDIKYLTSFVDLNIGVITGIGEIPVHIEFFKSPVQVAREKAGIIDFLGKDDLAILNFDDERVKLLAQKTRAKILSYGFSDAAKVRATNYELNIVPDMESCGIIFKIEYQGKTIPVRKEGIFGKHQAYAMLAGVAAGMGLGMNLLEAVEALGAFKPPRGRLQMIEGVKRTWILDDTYNASPTATLAALETLAQFEGRRKIAVLGDMLELGEFTENAHFLVGRKAAESADLFFAVGDRMRFAAQAAQEKTSKQKIFWFETAEAAKLPLQKMIQKGDVILVKGSQSMRMEKIVEEIMAQPQKASELLVRQEKNWKKG